MLSEKATNCWLLNKFWSLLQVYTLWILTNVFEFFYFGDFVIFETPSRKVSSSSTSWINNFWHQYSMWLAVEILESKEVSHLATM